jgi:hypothetical protein
MCPRTPILSPEYSHKAGLQTVITSIPLRVRPVIQRRPRGARYNGPDHTWALGLNEDAPWEDVAAGLRQSAESCEGCPCPLCLCRTSDCSEGPERRVASLPSPQQHDHNINHQGLAGIFLFVPAPCLIFVSALSRSCRPSVRKLRFSSLWFSDSIFVLRTFGIEDQQHHFVSDNFVLSTFGGEEDPQHLWRCKNTRTQGFYSGLGHRSVILYSIVSCIAKDVNELGSKRTCPFVSHVPSLL